jgi:glycosyltransferase involved in cell wall biosynthesis
MNNPPLISIIIPAYNHEKFIAEAIESILNQTLQDFELIIIDDGSQDNTGRIAKKYAQPPRIRYIYQKNQDAFNTINRGLNEAKGEFLAILNSDDVYEKDRLEVLLKKQKENNAQSLFTDITLINERSEIIDNPSHFWIQWHTRNRSFYFECHDLYTAFLKSNLMVTTSNMFITREAFKKVGEFAPIRYLHDYDYIFRLMLAFPESVVYLHDKKLLRYRIHKTNTIKEGAIIARRQDQEIIKKYMLAGILPEARRRCSVASERLLELEQEINSIAFQKTKTGKLLSMIDKMRFLLNKKR